MSEKQSNRLTKQQKSSHGAVGIFGNEAKIHDAAVSEISKYAKTCLENEFPKLTFRYRESLSKKEINNALQKIDKTLGTTLFVPDSKIKPDGGLIEVKDDDGNWRVST
nr:EcoRI family type II restriction endonuclease [uncultured Fibrobacter sp.]